MTIDNFLLTICQKNLYWKGKTAPSNGSVIQIIIFTFSLIFTSKCTNCTVPYMIDFREREIVE